MTETAICRKCDSYVPMRALIKGPDLDGTGICQECWIDD